MSRQTIARTVVVRSIALRIPTLQTLPRLPRTHAPPSRMRPPSPISATLARLGPRPPPLPPGAPPPEISCAGHVPHEPHALAPLHPSRSISPSSNKIAGRRRLSFPTAASIMPHAPTSPLPGRLPYWFLIRFKRIYNFVLIHAYFVPLPHIFIILLYHF